MPVNGLSTSAPTGAGRTPAADQKQRSGAQPGQHQVDSEQPCRLADHLCTSQLSPNRQLRVPVTPACCGLPPTTSTQRACDGLMRIRGAST